MEAHRYSACIHSGLKTSTIASCEEFLLNVEPISSLSYSNHRTVLWKYTSGFVFPTSPEPPRALAIVRSGEDLERFNTDGTLSKCLIHTNFQVFSIHVSTEILFKMTSQGWLFCFWKNLPGSSTNNLCVCRVQDWRVASIKKSARRQHSKLMGEWSYKSKSRHDCEVLGRRLFVWEPGLKMLSIILNAFWRNEVVKLASKLLNSRIKSWRWYYSKRLTYGWTPTPFASLIQAALAPVPRETAGHTQPQLISNRPTHPHTKRRHPHLAL